MKSPQSLQAALSRERDRIREEMLGIHGLLPLLMKQRNGKRWTPDERAQLRGHLRSLTSLSPYLVALLSPGSFVLVPVLAWWLDRRRQKRDGAGQAKTRTVPAAATADMPAPPAKP